MGDWKVRKLGAALGAEITGGSLANAGAREIDLIKSWLAEHHVIFFLVKRSVLKSMLSSASILESLKTTRT